MESEKKKKKRMCTCGDCREWPDDEKKKLLAQHEKNNIDSRQFITTKDCFEHESNSTRYEQYDYFYCEI